MPAPQPMPAYQQPQAIEIAAAPLPPPVALPVREPLIVNQPQPSYQPQQPLAMPTAPAQLVAVPATQPERSYVAIVDIKPVTYEARPAHRLPLPAEKPASEQGKVTLRVVVPGEK